MEKQKRRITKLPKSHATNAYKLLGRVRQVILAEPKRYNQELWIVVGKEDIEAGGYKPASCGTMACIAGWVVALAAPKFLEKPGSQVQEKATELITGGNMDSDLWNHIWDLFGAYVLSRYRSGGKLLPTIGTKAYARLGARHITQFMKQHEADLKAVKIRSCGEFDNCYRGNYLGCVPKDTRNVVSKGGHNALESVI